MTLYALYEDGSETSWYVGQQLVGHLRNPLSIIYIAADGTELDYINNRFTGIPKSPKGRYVRWYGDHARFIVANLR